MSTPKRTPATRAYDRPSDELVAALAALHREKGLQGMAAESGLHIETIAKAILRETLYKGSLARLRDYVAQVTR